MTPAPAPGPVFLCNYNSVSCSGSGQNSQTPAPAPAPAPVVDHLCYLLAGFLACNDKTKPNQPFNGVNKYANPSTIKGLKPVLQEKERSQADDLRRGLHGMH